MNEPMANGDITNSDQFEEVFAKQLQEIDKNYADFLTTLAFEFRTPLSAIIGLSQLLLESKDEPLTETQRKLVTSIQQSTNSLRKIEQYVRDIIRVAGDYLYLSIADVDLKDIITEAIPPYWRENYKQMEFEQNVPKDLPIIQADRRQIHHIMQNLFSSASVRLTDRGKVTLTASFDNDQVTISIGDTGSVISDSVIAVARSAKAPVYWRMEHDDWLLAMSRYLIEKHGGTMQIETQEGKGSLVTFTLPIRQPEGNSP